MTSHLSRSTIAASNRLIRLRDQLLSIRARANKDRTPDLVRGILNPSGRN
jgi:hypothetical protein